ncbi:outer membrane protein assembly factor BamE domain-containing protein [Gemmata sp.]|uniref:outer membrane protein assembly factor BamE domain-containing protein n=1 Tax=Gemmata sp. TaxID=1914242 RepID=UPI003F701CDF
MHPRRHLSVREAIELLVLVLCVPIVIVAIWLATARPGIGDVDVAKSKIKNGMTKDQVRSVLGAPHQDGGTWLYWNTRLGDSILRVHFGDDHCVISTDCWAN